MKKVMTDVKSKGVVVDKVEVTVYEGISEAVKALGDAVCLKAINKMVSDGITNPARAAKVRPSTPEAQLKKLAKTNPAVKAKIEALLKEYQEEDDAEGDEAA